MGGYIIDKIKAIAKVLFVWVCEWVNNLEPFHIFCKVPNEAGILLLIEQFEQVD